MKNFKIKAIQYYPEELYNALDLLKDGFNIIYSNLKSSINLNGIRFKTRKFDTMLYNEEDKVIILLMNGCEVTKNDIIEYLEVFKKTYAEVTFEENIYEYKDGNNLPDLRFVNDKKDLCEELTDCLINNINKCIYYPNIKGVLDLGYISKYDHRFSINISNYKGILKFENKIIIISKNQNLINENIIKILKSFQINYDINYDEKPNLYVKNFKEKVKQLKYGK